ncbi:MAG: DUF4083 family protein [Blastochloris sp.]|nr:DUF4083 family protein [Blastochloris sp.]
MKMILIAAEASKQSTWLDIIELILPLLVFLGLLWFFLRRHSRLIGRNMEHMDALEKKADRIIELLEEANKKN